MLAAEQLYTFLGTQRHSGGAFISLLTEGAGRSGDPRHYHDKVTETFFCIKGALQMFLNDESFCWKRAIFCMFRQGPSTPSRFARGYTLYRLPDSRDIRELLPLSLPALRWTHLPSDAPPFRFDRVIQHMGELDLRMVGRPGAAARNRRGMKTFQGRPKLYPVEELRDQIYSHAGGKPRLADLYLPSLPEGKAPVIVWVHGGGWRFGDRHLAPGPVSLYRGARFAIVASITG